MNHPSFQEKPVTYPKSPQSRRAEPDEASVDDVSATASADEVVPSPSFPAIEEQVLAFWKADDTFRASIAQRAEQGAEEWVFYDGPPFANGLPHYGHLLTGYAKDLFPRYQTMRGKRVERRFGWDTHGLPAELEAERQLGITDKSQIEEMGIAAFNKVARESVLKYTHEWQEYVTRQARWVDFDNDYKTLDITFMESAIWAFKQLHDKGLAYEGYRVLPYCWRDQTPLSNHELRMDDDVYKIRQDQSVTVAFPLTGERAEGLGLGGVQALAWTTTPWTLPTNAALAVGPGISYVVVPAGPAFAIDGFDTSTASTTQPASGAASTTQPAFLIAEDLAGAYAKELGYADAHEVRAAATTTLLGSDLFGVHYQRLWDYFADEPEYVENAWRILPADFVTTADGTGIVHLAPAYGEDDQKVCEENGIPVMISVNDGGVFLPRITEVAGQQVFDANKPLTKLLREMGRLVRVASYEHSYPHCWRCRNPLIYRAVSSWFVRVTEFRDRMVELNQQINWVPDNVKDGQFGKWLEGARDWSISRNRFWGSPIPVWKSDNPDYPRVDVYGSLDELERDFGVRPTDLHRPHIDDLTRPNPDDPSGASTMRRIPDVLDVWFDSGSMPFAQVHYPFENRDWFDTHNPADYIVEYIGQTRGWFYTMHVLATALFDRPAFKNVISHGIVLGKDGQKMSKSLRNYPDVNEVFERDGSDAMRWFLMSSSVLRGGNLVVTEEGIREGARQVLLPLWSTYYFFTLYANADGYDAVWRTDSANVLDRYLLAKTGDVIRTVQDHLDALDSTLAAATLRDFADVLTNWYVRRSRDRFWSGSATQDGRDAFDTLFTVLETITRVAAPFLPLITERMWQGLTGGRSVHLTNWPDASVFPNAAELVVEMDHVREIVSTALALRKQTGRRVRLPLAGLVVVTDRADALNNFADILRDELNVKTVTNTAWTENSAAEFGITSRLSVNARAAGPRLGKDVQRIIQAAKSGDWMEIDGVVVAGGTQLESGEYELTLETAATGDHDDRALALIPSGGFVLLDVTTTPELEAEGLQRDVIRAVQDTRKAAGFDVSDRIVLDVVCFDQDDADALVLDTGADIPGETLATEFSVHSPQTYDLLPGLADQLVSEWIGAVAAVDVEHFASFEANAFANRGAFVVALSRTERTQNV
ncbi:MAG: isoleucine--tRNA ligase [Actinobacteria bacterium]|nr:isoleucine--tRNA ligase [Actinomycetota bacterium]